MAPKAPSPLPAAQMSASLSHRRRCLQALSRLSERDTQARFLLTSESRRYLDGQDRTIACSTTHGFLVQAVGSEELTGIIASTADAAEASTLLSLLCNTGLDQRPHARKVQQIEVYVCVRRLLGKGLVLVSFPCN